MVASGTACRIAYLAETTRGTTPTGAGAQFTVQRGISRNINLKKQTIESQEAPASRQRTDVRHGFQTIEGEVKVELSMKTYSDWLLWSMGAATWLTPVSATHATHTLSVTGTNAFTRVTGSWLDDGYRPGDWITATNFTTPGNNGQHRAVSVTNTVLTTASTLTNEAGVTGATIAYVGQKAIVSSGNQLLKTFSLEREILDMNSAGLDVWSIFKGVAINRLTVDATPEGMLSGAFGLLGMSGTLDGSATADNNAVYTAAPTNSPLAAIDGTVYNGAFTANATRFGFTLDNQRTTLAQIGQKTTSDIYEGIAKVTGSMSILLTNTTRAGWFANETETVAQQIRVNELGTSEFMCFNFYRLKYTSFEIDPPQNGPVIQNIGWEALAQTFTGTTVTSTETMAVQCSVI